MRILMLVWWVQVLSAQGPPAFSLELRLLNPHVFRQGERIAAELNLPHPEVRPPAAEGWQFAGILLDPPAGCGTVVKPCVLNEPYIGGIFSPSDHTSLELNSYLPQLPPGRYRVAALARKLVLRDHGPAGTTYVYPDPPQYTVSGYVPIEIVLADADWLRQTITKSATATTDAAQQLASLNDPAAWTASLELLPNDENVVLAGLARARPATAVCDLMQARVPAPSQSVSVSYLNRMTDICARANLPPEPAIATRPAEVRAVISATPPPAAPLAPPNPELKKWSENWQGYTINLMSKATAALAGSLSSKQPQAKWDAFATLLQHVSQVRNDRPAEPDPAWIPLLTREFVGAFPAIEVSRKQYFIDMLASTIDSPELVPLLESVLDSWKPGDYYEAAHSALQALNRVDPARARARALAELAKDKTWLDLASLELVPASGVPPMDDALIESLARAQRPGGWNPQLIMAAIALYATPEALPRIRSIYGSQKDSCQPELAAYFVRVDPAYAERVFHSEAWDMHSPPPRCTVQYFNRTPPLAMGPALEQYIAAYLMHSDVYTKSTAAKVLARYGTASALPRLWETFRYFHDYWYGKGDELARNGQGVALEVDLRNAIARGRGWLATEEDLRAIESLCISDRCIQETQQDLESIKVPLSIEITPQASGIYGRVAQYSGLDSVEGMESKLAEFPRGTRFILHVPSGPAAAIAAEIRSFAAEKGLAVTTP
jgi:hypothetical protein